MNGIELAQQNAERDAQVRWRTRSYIENSLMGLRPIYLPQEAQEYLMEKPDAAWNDFSTRIFQRDLAF